MSHKVLFAGGSWKGLPPVSVYHTEGKTNMENAVRNVFCGMGVVAVLIILAVLVAALVYTFIDECTKLDNDMASAFSIVALVLMLVGGVFLGLMAAVG